MTKKALTDLVRSIATGAAGVLASKGIIAENATESLVAAVLAVAVLVWTLTTKDNK